MIYQLIQSIVEMRLKYSIIITHVVIQLALLSTLILSSSARHLRHSNPTIKQCSHCPPGWGVSEECTNRSDTVCKKCVDSETYSPHHSYHAPCWKCSQCGPGLYRHHLCTSTRDTFCDSCYRLRLVDEELFFNTTECVHQL